MLVAVANSRRYFDSAMADGWKTPPYTRLRELAPLPAGPYKICRLGKARDAADTPRLPLLEHCLSRGNAVHWCQAGVVAAHVHGRLAAVWLRQVAQ